MSPLAATGPSPARRRAAESLGAAAAHFPQLPPLPFDTTGLTPRDAALAQAIRRTALQRWMTLECLLNRWLRRPAASCEPALRGILLAGSAALLFLDRQPAHAVVNDSVALARGMVRPGAGGLVNAVLRRISDAVAARDPAAIWQPNAGHLPMETGICILAEPALPDPADAWNRHVAVATSHPDLLVAAWRRRFGREKTASLCRHGIKSPPVILSSDETHGMAADPDLQPHQAVGHAVWEGPAGALTTFLESRSAFRVQDPTAALPLAGVGDTAPETILDYCAGLGTKTHQAVGMFPRVRVVAHEVDAGRRSALIARFRAEPRVNVTGTRAEVSESLPDGADLLLLDVPCSNTGVLARRPEARYRYSRRSLTSLVALQRRIALAALPHLQPGGRLLYSTCSLDEAENEAQARWLVATCKLALLEETTTLPGGSGKAYRDGGYCAWLRAGTEDPGS